MDDESPTHELDPEAAEQLINRASLRARHHTASPPVINQDGPLSTLLNAATTPDLHRALAGEQAAIAAFRAAQPQPRSARHRTIRRIALAAIAALGLGGTAITAIQTGLPLTLHPRADTTQTSPATSHAPIKPPATSPSAALSPPAAKSARQPSKIPAPDRTTQDTTKPGTTKPDSTTKARKRHTVATQSSKPSNVLAKKPHVSHRSEANPRSESQNCQK